MQWLKDCVGQEGRGANKACLMKLWMSVKLLLMVDELLHLEEPAVGFIWLLIYFWPFTYLVFDLFCIYIQSTM